MVALALTADPVVACGQGVDEIKARYTKFEYRIPMRDGAGLWTAVYVPKDAGQGKTYPILLNRTPYSVAPYGLDRVRESLGPSELFGKSGYIFVYQDVRGRVMSEGEFVNMRPHRTKKSNPQEIDESTDTYDTIEWLVKSIPGNSGKVGQYGISYPGFYTAAGMIDAHPALIASSPQAPVMDWFTGDDFHHNGAFFLPHAFNFLARFGKPRPEPTTQGQPPFDHKTPDGYDFFLRMGSLANADEKYFKGSVAFWNEMIEHPNYDDFWKARNLRPHLRNIQPAVLTVGGWYDAENLYGAIECYRSVENSGPKRANAIVMGPWSHGQWAHGDASSLGNLSFNQKTGEFYRESIEFPFFEHHLKGAADPGLPEAYMFETGTNQWRRFDVWPPRESSLRWLYLRTGGRLEFEPATASASEPAFHEYVSDPAKPVPATNAIDINMPGDYMTSDQRHASWRPDVLVYESEPLTSDMTLAGPIEVELHVSTTGTDADWVVKLIDVYPGTAADPHPNPKEIHLGNYQQLVRGDVMRGRFRDGLDRPKPFQPGEPVPITFRLNDVYHTFRTGHRLMVHIQSSWFPIVDRNPQSYVDIGRAKPEDYVKATQRMFHAAPRASRLGIRVLPNKTAANDAQ
jgi:putative CocE/NonD family hydrolase